MFDDIFRKVWPPTIYFILKDKVNPKWKLVSQENASQYLAPESSSWTICLTFEARSFIYAKKKYNMFLELVSEINNMEIRKVTHE